MAHVMNAVSNLHFGVFKFWKYPNCHACTLPANTLYIDKHFIQLGLKSTQIHPKQFISRISCFISGAGHVISLRFPKFALMISNWTLIWRTFTSLKVLQISLMGDQRHLLPKTVTHVRPPMGNAASSCERTTVSAPLKSHPQHQKCYFSKRGSRLC